MSQRSYLTLVTLLSALAWAYANEPEYTFGSTKVRFLGKSPNFQIYPNTSLSSFLQLRFSKFEERDVNDQKVQGHSVESLASADPVWTAGNITLANGANASYVTMTVDPASRNGFDFSCGSSGGGGGNGNAGRRMLASSSGSSNASVSVTVYFGFDSDTSFPFGFNKTANVSKGGLKFTVTYTNWQFCNVNNTLNMRIDLLVKNNGTANTSVSTAGDGSKQLQVPLGDNATSTITFANYAYEAVNGNRSMPVTVSLDTSGGGSTIALKLPNPSPNNTVYYDPTVTTTVSTTSGTGTGSGSGGGSASGVRLTFWSAAAAVLLSAFLLA